MEVPTSRRLRIAVCQYAPAVGELAANREAAVAWAQRAAAEGAGLVVLPELASSGYVFADLGEARACAEPVDGPFVEALTQVCRQYGTYVVAGMDELGPSGLHNSAVVVGPEGGIATYRKLHLFYDEKSWFVPGDHLVVVDLPFGRLGMLICYDLWFSEAMRGLALAGAEVVAVPTNWVASFKRTVADERGWIQGDLVAVAGAAQNGLVVACADRIGSERQTRFLGASLVVGADGWPVAGPAPLDGECLLVADVDLASVAAARRRTPRNHLLDDRRPEAYVAVVVSASSGPVAAAATPSAGQP